MCFSHETGVILAGAGSRSKKSAATIADSTMGSARPVRSARHLLLGTSKLYASMVRALHSHPARSARGRGSCQPQVSGPGGLYSATGGGYLLVPILRQQGVQQDHGHVPAGD